MCTTRHRVGRSCGPRHDGRDARHSIWQVTRVVPSTLRRRRHLQLLIYVTHPSPPSAANTDHQPSINCTYCTIHYHSPALRQSDGQCNVRHRLAFRILLRPAHSYRTARHSHSLCRSYVTCCRQTAAQCLTHYSLTYSLSLSICLRLLSASLSLPISVGRKRHARRAGPRDLPPH